MIKIKNTLEKEDDVHCSLVQYCERKYKGKLFLHHSPNENPKAQKTTVIRYNQKMKMLGRKKGFPDLILYKKSGEILHLEIKTTKGRLTDSQKELQDKLTLYGFPVTTCYGVNEGMKIIDRFMRK